MVIHLIKFIHLLCTLGLLGSISYCLVVTVRFKTVKHEVYLYKLMLLFGFFAALTGTLLIYPSHFSFHTPWIEAAYLFGLSFALGIIFLMLTRHHPTVSRFRPLIYGVLGVILICIAHDAVTKSTFLF